MISPSEITIVYQGNVSTTKDREGNYFRDLLDRTRAALPGAKIVLSTWRDTKLPRSIKVDEVVRSRDPGSLPAIKFDDHGVNNINRQIVTTVAGLQRVQTKYAIKLRTDAFLETDDFLRDYVTYSHLFPSNSPRILTTSFFSIDPDVFEHMPFHVSDWFHFSTTERLLKYWSVPPMSVEDATHYERHPHARRSSYLDRKFRVKLAVEQHLCNAFAERSGYETPKFHNDCRAEVISSFRKFLTSEMLILDAWHAGLRFPKYGWAFKSNMQSMNCLMFLDWYKACCDAFGKPVEDDGLYAAATKRSNQKMRVRIGIRILGPIAFIIFSKRFDAIGSRLLKLAMLNFKPQQNTERRGSPAGTASP